MSAPSPAPPWSRRLGAAFRVVFRGILVLRRPRPIHQHGTVLEGRIRWMDGEQRSGIGWVDAPPPDRSVTVVARLSRSIGLAPGLPDVFGVALRTTEGGTAPADLEFAMTGRRWPLRFVLWPRLRPSSGFYGTLLPYRGPRGLVLLGARPGPRRLPAGGAALDAALDERDWTLTLAWATPRGPWRAFAVLTLRRRADQEDHRLRFDAVRRMLPGAGVPAWVRAVREPSYALAQDAGRALSGASPAA
jgi:hypothetical protein